MDANNIKIANTACGNGSVSPRVNARSLFTMFWCLLPSDHSLLTFNLSNVVPLYIWLPLYIIDTESSAKRFGSEGHLNVSSTVHAQYCWNVQLCSTMTQILSVTDMHLFGHCPAHDEFYLVVCSHCNQVVKPQAFNGHCGKLQNSSMQMIFAEVHLARSSQHNQVTMYDELS